MYAVNVRSPAQLPLVSGCQNSSGVYCVSSSIAYIQSYIQYYTMLYTMSVQLNTIYDFWHNQFQQFHPKYVSDRSAILLITRDQSFDSRKPHTKVFLPVKYLYK